MAGSLIKLQETIISSSTASVTLGDTYWDSSYDVYMVRINNVTPSLDSRYLKIRVTEGGTPNTTSNYDSAYKMLRANTTFDNNAGINGDHWRLLTTGTGTGNQDNCLLYLFNFNSTTEYAFITIEETMIDSGENLAGWQGGAVFTSTGTARNGLQFFFDSGDIAGGKFSLYALKK